MQIGSPAANHSEFIVWLLLAIYLTTAVWQEMTLWTNFAITLLTLLFHPVQFLPLRATRSREQWCLDEAVFLLFGFRSIDDERDVALHVLLCQEWSKGCVKSSFGCSLKLICSKERLQGADLPLPLLCEAAEQNDSEKGMREKEGWVWAGERAQHSVSPPSTQLIPCHHSIQFFPVILAPFPPFLSCLFLLLSPVFFFCFSPAISHRPPPPAHAEHTYMSQLWNLCPLFQHVVMQLVFRLCDYNYMSDFWMRTLTFPRSLCFPLCVKQAAC